MTGMNEQVYDDIALEKQIRALFVSFLPQKKQFFLAQYQLLMRSLARQWKQHLLHNLSFLIHLK